jgi:hypothetical protein
MKRLFFFLVMMVLQVAMGAQCAMCRASAESASQNDNPGIGEGLNSGIVYLMGIPYILMAVVGIVFFRKKIAALFKS